jgi:hypothetical protein
MHPAVGRVLSLFHNVRIGSVGPKSLYLIRARVSVPGKSGQGMKFVFNLSSIADIKTALERYLHSYVPSCRAKGHPHLTKLLRLFFITVQKLCQSVVEVT